MLGSSSPEAQPAATSSRAAASRLRVRRCIPEECHGMPPCIHAGPVEPAGRVVPLLRGADDPDARRRGRGLPGAQGRLRPRQPGPADLGADRVRAALPPAGQVGAGPARQPGLGGRRGLRRQLPRTPVRAAATGHRGPARRARRPGAEPRAGPVPAAVGDVPRRGPVRRPVRDHHQDPPRDGRRHRCRRHRPGHPGHQPGRARAAGRHLAAVTGAVLGRAGGRRGRRDGPPPDRDRRHRARRPRPS